MKRSVKNCFSKCGAFTKHIRKINS